MLSVYLTANTQTLNRLGILHWEVHGCYTAYIGHSTWNDEKLFLLLNSRLHQFSYVACCQGLPLQ